MRLLAILFIFCLINHANAQKKYHWKKYDQMAITKDTMVLFENFREENSILEPIQQSKAPIEIRCYSSVNGGRGVVLIMQYFKKSVIYKRFYRQWSNWNEFELTKADSELVNKGKLTFYNWNIQTLEVNKSPDSILQSLSDAGLFTLNNTDSIKISMRAKHLDKDSTGKVSRYSFDEKPSTFFLIKINQRFRIFTVRWVKYDDEFINQESFLFGGEAEKIFRQLFESGKVTETKKELHLRHYF